MFTNILRRFRRSREPLAKLSVREVRDHLLETFPAIVRLGHYDPPEHRCSRWILVNGPAYQDEGYVGSVIVESSKLVNWMTHHAENVFTTVVAQQQAMEYLPQWLRNADASDETITLLDTQQRKVLDGHCLKFLWSDWGKIWCPSCQSTHPRIKEHDDGWAQTGKLTIRFDDWHCPEGHLIFKYTPHEIRWILR